MAKSSDEMVESMIANLEEKTGKGLEEWIAIVHGSGFEKHGQQVSFLKQTYGIGHGYANLVAHKAREAGASGGSSGVGAPAAAPADAGAALAALVDAQYAGAKAGLRPWYDAILRAVEGFGGDVEVAPKKTYVSFRRKRQFALVQPSTKTRLDVGLRLDAVEPSGRLEASGSFNTIVSHRVRVESADEVDEQLVGWLRAAYDDAG